ncbi:MgtC/SapB family protein [Candidatus Woesearchaeota archaeon]|nr:MgtC/SapB family protein [Candidatus Woesearchaeota archaeon]
MSMLPYLDFLARIFAAALFGGLIGLEREKDKKAAGFRTHILVCLGSALMTCLAAASMSQDPMGRDSVARVVAAIITGIGFLGAGNILRERDEHQIHGLTTAASIWIVAGIGIGVGLGFYLFSFIVTVLVVLILMINDYKYLRIDELEGKIKKKKTVKK